MKLEIKKRVFGLDVLRALAITFVLVSHCTFLIYPEETYVWLNLIRLMGAVGVDLFFILSGYLIGGILLKLIESNKFTYLELIKFWKRRWFRTLPNYFLVLVLNILITLLIRNSLPDAIGNYFVFLQNFISPHPDYFTEAWSLSIEEYAYLGLPLLFYLVMALFKTTERKKLFIRTTIIVVLLLYLFKINYYMSVEVESYAYWSATFRKVVIYRLDSIYLGFIVVYLIKEYNTWIKRYTVLLALIGLILFLSIHISILVFNLMPNTHLGFYSFLYLQLLGLSLALVFPFCIQINYNGLIKGVVEFTSTRSYAIYLVNYSLILLHLQMVFEVSSMSVVNKIILVVVFLVISILISNAIYVYFENPILKYRDRKIPK